MIFQKKLFIFIFLIFCPLMQAEKPVLNTNKHIVSSTVVHTFNVRNALYKLKKISQAPFAGFQMYGKYLNKMPQIIQKSLNGVILIDGSHEDLELYNQIAQNHAQLLQENKIILNSALNNIAAASFIAGIVGFLFSHVFIPSANNSIHSMFGVLMALYAGLPVAAYYGLRYELQEECTTLFMRHLNRLEYASDFTS